VKVLTGGIAHEPKGRFGEIPKPTVKSGWKKTDFEIIRPVPKHRAFYYLSGGVYNGTESKKTPIHKSDNKDSHFIRSSYSAYGIKGTSVVYTPVL